MFAQFSSSRRKRPKSGRPNARLSGDLKSLLSDLVRARRYGWASLSDMLDSPECPLRDWAVRLKLDLLKEELDRTQNRRKPK